MCREEMRDAVALTLLPGVLLARYLGDSSEEAMQHFSRLGELLRPLVAHGRAGQVAACHFAGELSARSATEIQLPSV